jgi:hypothetical protein
MILDDTLLETARSLLHERFPDGAGSACAAYSLDGRVYTGTAAPNGSLEEPELAPIEDAAKNGELLVALVTLAWDGPGTAVLVRPPRAATLDRLQEQAQRHAQIAVGGDGEHVVVRALWELVRGNPNAALLAGNFGGGMKAIGPDLVSLAKDPGVPRTRAEFPAHLRLALDREEIRANARRPGHPTSSFVTPMHVDSVSLRQIWLAFEYASEKFVFGLVDSWRPRLAELGCNPQDVVHIKQGWEALRNSFGVLVIWVGTRRPVEKESPFNPYDASTLTAGVPIHEFLPLREPPAAPEEARNEALVRDLVEILAKKEGGFASYLRQRNLFRIDLFDGGGTGGCPFATMSAELFHETARTLESALSEGRILLSATAR